MNDTSNPDAWHDDTYALEPGREALARVAVAAGIPTPVDVLWRAGVVVMFGTGENGFVNGYVQYFQDLDWRTGEPEVLTQVIAALQERVAAAGAGPQ